MPDTTEVVAHIYDRHATPYPRGLRARLEACGAYARTSGWTIGGWHVDKGEDAVSDDTRPALDVAIRLMQGAPERRILLVAGFDRLHNNPSVAQQLANRVRAAGGEVLAVDTAGRGPVEAR